MCIRCYEGCWKTNFVRAEKCEFRSFLGKTCGKVRADPEKIRAANRKKFQYFLRFANFNRHFIKDYSGVVSPLTSLTSVLLVHRSRIYQTKPCSRLPHFNSEWPSTSVCGRGGLYWGRVLLSQPSGSDQRLHPCAFFSRKLTVAEKNWHWWQGTTDCQDGAGWVVSLVGGFGTTI